MRTVGAVILCLFWSGAVPAQSMGAEQAAARARVMTGIMLPCPGRGAVSDAIIVCGRTREDPYRIPEVIRAEPQERKAGAATAWGTRTADADEAARGGRAGGSSVDGSGGQSGLHQKIRREWELERQSIDSRRVTPEE